MTDFLQIAQLRQSCRNFSGERVEHEKLVKCVEAGRLTPSACNSQPWSFIVVESPEVAAEVAKCGQQNDRNPYISNASAFIIILEEFALLNKPIRHVIDSQYFAKGDLGAATLSVCLEAATQGLGTCIIGMFDRVTLCQIFNLPLETRFASFIAVGIPADKAIREKSRKPIEELAKFI